MISCGSKTLTGFMSGIKGVVVGIGRESGFRWEEYEVRGR